jgi:hypothetical protein
MTEILLHAIGTVVGALFAIAFLLAWRRYIG